LVNETVMTPKLFQWNSLKTRVTLFTLVIFLACIWMLAFYASHILQGDMRRVLGDQQFSTVSLIAAEINEEIEYRIQGLELTAQGITPTHVDHPTALQALLQDRPLLHKLFNDGVAFGDVNGTVLADFPQVPGRVGANFKERDYVIGPLKEGKVTIGAPVRSKLTQNPSFVIAVPVKDTQGTVIGVLAGVINLGKPNFLDQVTANRYGATGGYLVLSPKNRLIVTATDKRRVMAMSAAPGTSPWIDRIFRGYEGTTIYVNQVGVQVLTSVKGVAAAGWIMVAEVPTKEAFAPIHAMQQRMLLAALLLTLLAGGLTWWMLRRQLAPLLTAVKTLADLSETNQTPQSLPITSRDEIGTLIGSFNHLLETLSKREVALKESEASYRSLVERTPEPIAVHRGGKLVYVNPAGVKMFGAKSAQELVGKPIPELVHPDFHQAVLAPVKKQKEDGVAVPMVEEKFLQLDGTPIDVEVQSMTVIYEGESAIQMAMRDITGHKKAEEEIRSLAFSDPLTGLPNRRLLMDRLEQALVGAMRHGHQDALLFVDMDDFKTLNDSLGHDKGDQLLQQIAQRVLSCVREGDTVARLGGDEFVVLLEDLDESPQEAATQAEAVARKIHNALRQPYQLDSHGYHSTASIGVTLFGGAQRESIDEPLKRAELAMYKAKAVGRNNLRFFEPEMRSAINARATLEADLHEALTQGQFLLYYQAQVGADAHLTGVEALVRWQHPERGLVPPTEFIAVAEASGLILSLGRWVLVTACKQLAAWAQRPEMADLTISVNVSARQFRLPNFVEDVLAILDATCANAERLKLELTESLLLDNMKDIIAKMSALKGSGVGFSLDDFGTGYSSLSYLQRLPLHELKIDQGFVRDILTDPNDAAIAKMVVALAESMGLVVIAEGVETEAQRDALAGLGCHAYQGYLFSRPLPLAEFEAFAVRA